MTSRTSPHSPSTVTPLDALEHIAQWAEHFSFMAAVDVDREELIVALGQGFQALQDMAREAIRHARTSA